MSESVSRNFFIAEALLLVIPLSTAFLLSAPFLVISSVLYITPADIANALITGMALLSLASGWVLTLSYLRGGRAALRKRSAGWWLISTLGSCIALAAVLSNILPPSEQYSPVWSFRQDFGLFAFGLPLLLPLGHLFAEAYA